MISGQIKLINPLTSVDIRSHINKLQSLNIKRRYSKTFKVKNKRR